MRTELKWNFEDVYQYKLVWKEKIAATGKVQRITDKYIGTKRMFLSYYKARLENERVEKYRILHIQTKITGWEHQWQFLSFVDLNRLLGLEV